VWLAHEVVPLAVEQGVVFLREREVGFEQGDGRVEEVVCCVAALFCVQCVLGAVDLERGVYL
jgi:hypothetical protein